MYALALGSVDEDVHYKHLGILQTGNNKHTEVKKVRNKFITTVKKILKSKFRGGKTIKAMNTWAVSILRYTGKRMDWTQVELKALDKKTRKVMIMNHGLCFQTH